ncbi:MAG: hypothetical protein JSS82_11660 [Bacteroidetes bacterium]|nr:hypothetical protein [Bacteroidota bacterium]
MKHISFLSALLLAFTIARGQACDCKTQFEFVKRQVETNYPGFRDKVNPQTASAYTTFYSKTLEKVKKASKQQYCYQAIKEWLYFFNDGHLQLNKVDTRAPKDTTGQAERIRNTEIIDIPERQIEALKKSKGIEGIYRHNDSVYTIAIIKSPTDFRDYAAVIVESRTPLWTKGQVKMELRHYKDSFYTNLTYMRDHNWQVQGVVFEGDELNDHEWQRLGTVDPANSNATYNSLKPVASRQLSDKTFYIQIGSFQSWNAISIDSVLRADSAILSKTPNLIIDLRYNSGGTDYAYRPLRPWLYTNPIYNIGNDVYATSDNADVLLKYLNEPGFPEEAKAAVAEEAEEIKKNLGSFILHSSDDTIALNKHLPYPQKVVILVNGICAGSTEEFLLEAMQSKKVTIMGQRTAGTLDYSNVIEATSSCKEISFSYPSTRSRRLKLGQGIDLTGIRPAIVLAHDKDWVKEAQAWLEK